MLRAGAFFRLMRPVNLGILLLTQFLLLAKGSGWNAELLRFPACFLLTLAILGTAAAGNVINDIHDTATDAINKPQKQLIPDIISRRQALTFYFLLLSASLVAAWFTEPGFFLFCASGSLLLYFYTRELKGIPLAGNILIAMLTAAAVFSARLGLFDTTGIPFAELSALSFFVNLTRELIKDVQDMPGDQAAGIHTYPVRYGIKSTHHLAAWLLIPAVVIAAAPLLFSFETWPFRLHYTGAALLILWISIHIYRLDSPSRSGIISRNLKLILFYGLLGILWL
jgi:4-hydroxybenzoate polyprenyltransferase